VGAALPPSHISGSRTITTTPTKPQQVDPTAETQVLPVDDHAPPSEGAPSEKPRQTTNLELIGKYEGSGFKEPPYLVRRGDGQVIQLAPLLYLIVELADGARTNEEIAAAVSEAIKRGVSADNVRQLVDERLRPLGVIAAADGSEPELEKLDPMLALRFRAALVPPSVVNAITKVFKPLYFPFVVVAVLGGLVAIDVWLFLFHGVAQSLRQTLYDPALLLMMLGLIILSAAFHECGHATACAYGGAKPGAMGAGIYIVWPAFYTDVTDAYRLGKGGRLRTDLGGVYFNVIFILLTAGAYAVTGFEPLLLMIPIQHLEIVHQFLPFIRLDGYYIVSDLTGVPDMFSRIRPTLASLIPWKHTHDRVKELKPWVRAAVTAYVFTVIPLLLFLFGMMVINAPRIFATAWDSFFVQWHKVRGDFNGGSAFAGSFGILQMLVLLLPAAGIVVTFWRTAARIVRGVWRKTEGTDIGRAAFIGTAAAVAASMIYLWWPQGDYQPIQRGERGTLSGAVSQFAAIPTGRPALTKQRAAQLGGAGFRSRTPTRQRRLPTPTRTGSTSTVPTTRATTGTTRTTPSSPLDTVSTPSATTGSDTVTSSSSGSSSSSTSPSSTVDTQTATTATTP
jgi:putative peptide zinc metalloprotease protein